MLCSVIGKLSGVLISIYIILRLLKCRNNHFDI